MKTIFQKKLTKITTVLTAAAMLTAFPGFSTLKASAEEPETYSIAYVEDRDEWRWQEGSPYNEDKSGSDIYYLKDHIQNGDALVIYGTPDESITVEVPVHLSSLTLVSTSGTAVVHTNGIDEAFVLADSVAAINGNVKNAYMYDNARATFNNNIESLEVNAPDGVYSVVTCGGTVGHAKGYYEDNVFYDIYNVAAGKLSIETIEVKTDAQFYSTTPSAAAPQSSAPAQTGSSSQTGSSAGDYDDVPKTGEPNTIVVLLGIAALCFMGSRAFKRA